MTESKGPVAGSTKVNTPQVCAPPAAAVVSLALYTRIRVHAYIRVFEEIAGSKYFDPAPNLPFLRLSVSLKRLGDKNGVQKTWADAKARRYFIRTLSEP